MVVAKVLVNGSVYRRLEKALEESPKEFDARSQDLLRSVREEAGMSGMLLRVTMVIDEEG